MEVIRNLHADLKNGCFFCIAGKDSSYRDNEGNHHCSRRYVSVDGDSDITHVTECTGPFYTPTRPALHRVMYFNFLFGFGTIVALNHLKLINMGTSPWTISPEMLNIASRQFWAVAITTESFLLSIATDQLLSATRDYTNRTSKI